MPSSYEGQAATPFGSPSMIHGFDGNERRDVGPFPPAPGFSGDYATQTHAAAAVTYAAPLNPFVAHVLYGVVWSYSGGTPTGGAITVTDAGVTIGSFDITAAGPGSMNFTPPLSSSPGAAMVVTLADGGASLVGKLTCRHATWLTSQGNNSGMLGGPFSLNFSVASNSMYL
jgi:hypothetical protein